jgi:predicted ATPase
VHFLLETHSEHILLRLRRRIIETASENAPKEIDINRQLTNDDLALYFAERLHGQGIVQSVSINRLGEFEYVPAGFRDFFADDMEEILAISRAHRRAKALQEGDNDSTSN